MDTPSFVVPFRQSFISSEETDQWDSPHVSAKRIKLEHSDENAVNQHELGDDCQRCSLRLSNTRLSSYFMPTVQCDMVLRVFHEIEQQFKPFNVHRFVLGDRSSYFRQLLDGHTNQTGTFVVELNSYRFSVYLVYLQYIYTWFMDISAEILFELYQLVSDLDAENCRLIRLLKNYRRNVDFNEFVNLYLFYSKNGPQLYSSYDNCKMRNFFEDFIWLSLNDDNYVYLLSALRDTPMARRILDFQKNQVALRQSEIILEGLYYTQDLNNWPLLQQMPLALLYTVDRFFVFNSGKSLLVITLDDRVFALGVNEHGQLGVGHLIQVTLAEEVVELSGKKVTFVQSGSGHVMALTESKDLYGFGRNHKGQVGVGTRNDQLKPVLIMKNVLMVCCGDDHTVALDSDHNAWNWGSVAHGKTVCNFAKGDDPSKPIMIRKFACQNKKVASINCGKQNSVAVTTEQEVYIWGEFGDGFSTVKFVSPELTSDSRPSLKLINAISFGEHFLALSTNGVVHFVQFCGKFTFKAITSIKERVVSMHSPPERKSFAIFVGRSGQMYIFNGNVAQIIWQISLVDSFYKEGNPVTPLLAWLPPFLLDSNREKLIESFDQAASSDLTFSVNEQPIYLHRSVIQQRFPDLPQIFKSNWNDLKSILLLTQSPPYSVYLHYFRYLYTQTLSHVSHHDIKTIFGLYSIAQLHHDSKLETRCENFILKVLAASSASELGNSNWLADNLDVVQYFLTKKLSNFFSLKQTLEMYQQIPELRDALVPSITNNESFLFANPTYKQMDVTIRSELHSKIARIKQSNAESRIIECIQLD